MKLQIFFHDLTRFFAGTVQAEHIGRMILHNDKMENYFHFLVPFSIFLIFDQWMKFLQLQKIIRRHSNDHAPQFFFLKKKQYAYRKTTLERKKVYFRLLFFLLSLHTNG